MAHSARPLRCLLGTACVAGLFFALFAGQASSQGLVPPGGRTRIGPGFDCALARDALSGLICGSDQLSWTDLRFSQAYQALRLQVGEAGQSAVRQEAIDFQVRVYAQCRLPKVGFVPAPFRAETEICVGQIYEQQRGLWASRLSLPLQEEVNRPLPQHLELQSALQKLGYIPAGSAVDGVYGPATRAAIMAWQISRNVPPTGFFSSEEATALRQQAAAGPQQPPAPTAPPATVSAPPPPVPNEEAVRAAEERRLEIAKAEAEKAKSEADKAQADADRARAEADVFAARERADAEVRRKAAEQAKAEQDAKGIQP